MSDEIGSETEGYRSKEILHFLRPINYYKIYKFWMRIWDTFIPHRIESQRIEYRIRFQNKVKIIYFRFSFTYYQSFSKWSFGSVLFWSSDLE